MAMRRTCALLSGAVRPMYAFVMIAVGIEVCRLTVRYSKD